MVSSHWGPPSFGPFSLPAGGGASTPALYVINPVLKEEIKCYLTPPATLKLQRGRNFSSAPTKVIGLGTRLWLLDNPVCKCSSAHVPSPFSIPSTATAFLSHIALGGVEQILLQNNTGPTDSARDSEFVLQLIRERVLVLGLGEFG